MVIPTPRLSAHQLLGRCSQPPRPSSARPRSSPIVLTRHRLYRTSLPCRWTSAPSLFRSLTCRTLTLKILPPGDTRLSSPVHQTPTPLTSTTWLPGLVSSLQTTTIPRQRLSLPRAPSLPTRPTWAAPQPSRPTAVFFSRMKEPLSRYSRYDHGQSHFCRPSLACILSDW